MSNYYQVLGVHRSASQEEIRKAYLEAARKLHPDKNTSPGDTEYFLSTQLAYDILADPSKRAAYDASLPREQDLGFPIRQKCTFSRDFLLASPEPQLVYALLEFTPADSGGLSAASMPLNVCLLIDRSSSMQGAGMDTVKETVIQFLHQLRPQDTFSLVAFSDRAETIISSTSLEDHKKLEARIQMLQTFGGTEIYQGLHAAYTEVKRIHKPALLSHIILLTDGQTYGDETACLNLADEAASNHIGISALGIGHDWNDTFLDDLTRRTGGYSIYVSDPLSIQRSLKQKFNHLWRTFSHDLILTFDPIENVDLHYAFRLNPEPALLPTHSPLHLGPVLRDAPLTILMEFMLSDTSADQLSSTQELLRASLAFNNSTVDRSTHQTPFNLARPITRRSGMPEPPPIEIIDALSQLTLYRLQEQASLEVTAGAFDQASRHLQMLATHLLQQGDRDLARTVLLEAGNIKEKNTISKEGAKRIKYGTRALLLPAGGDQTL